MKIVKHIPNTITSTNLLCGVLGVIFTFDHRVDLAFYAMITAAVCDFFDGFSARLLKAYSPLGKELDSLADMVSFGVLPALMTYKLMSGLQPDSFLCYTPLLIAVFSGLRLAKFNIDERQSENFIGLATPACAMICGSFAYCISKDPGCILVDLAYTRFFIPAASVILCILLVCEIPMFSMKIKKGKTGKDPMNRLRVIFFIGIALLCVITPIMKWHWSLIILLTFVLYILLNCAAAVLVRK